MSIETDIEIIDFEKIDVYLINGNFKLNSPRLLPIHQKSFKCWHDVWSDFYKNEHKNSKQLNSDEFTRQDEILALFYKGECFGLTFFKAVDWEDATAPLDSYFSTWPESALEGLISRGKKILICSQFTITHNFRKRNSNIQWKSVLFNFSIKRFLESDRDGMTGTMRIKRGMEKISYEGGAVSILRNLTYKDLDETADLVGFYKKEVKEKYYQNSHAQDFDSCWERLNDKFVGQLRLVG